MENKNNYFVHMNCPNCGASMELKPGYAWECPHCNTKFYILPANKVEMVGINLQEKMDMIPEDLRLRVIDGLNHEAASKMGIYLLENGYITIKTEKDLLCPDQTVFSYMIKIVKPKEK